MARRKNFNAIAPGETLAEILLTDNDILQAAANKLDLPVDTVGWLLEGDTELTSEIAQKIEAAYGISAKFWLNLEAHYRKQLEKGKRLWVHRQPHAYRKRLERKSRS